MAARGSLNLLVTISASRLDPDNTNESLLSNRPNGPEKCLISFGDALIRGLDSTEAPAKVRALLHWYQWIEH